MSETRKLKMHYPLARINEPIITRLVTEFDLIPNLLRANVDASSGGWMVADITGEKGNIDNAIEWMNTHGITVTAE